MKLPAKIFREYDIRGIAGKDLNEESVTAIARAYTTLLRGKKKVHNCVAVCRDGRVTGKAYANAVIDGLTESGVNVIDLGQGPSPLLYYAMFSLPVDGGIMVTASHNPKQYNGLKIGLGKGMLHGKEIMKLRDIALKGEFPKAKKPVTITRMDLVPKYLKRIERGIKLKKKLKIVIDAANGVAGPIAIPLYEALGCEVIPMYCDVDGTFPNHPADPTVPENMKELQRAVKKHKADLGIGFDGDGDRIGAVDEKGQLIFGDRLLILYARNVLKDKPGATVIGEVKCSRTLYADIKKNGGKGIMSRTGHSLIKAAMLEHKAQLAGEMSGHMFFKHRWYGFDDALYAGARLLEIVAGGRKTLSQHLANVPETVVTPEIRIDTKDEIKFDVVKKATDHFQNKLGLDVITIDGARIEFEDGWGLLRASNTGPVLVMRCEAQTKKRLKEIQTLIESTVAKINK